MALAASLDGKYLTKLIDGNVDRDFIASALQYLTEHAVDAVGVTVMGGPQLQTAIAVRDKLISAYTEITRMQI